MIRRLAVAVAGLLLTAAAAIAATPHPAVDPQVRPGDDFYAYANGPWLKSLPAPQGLGRTDSTSELRVQNAGRVAALIETAATAPHGSAATRAIARKIADYHAARLDLAAIEARGLAPLAPDLAAIAAIGDRHALAVWLGRATRLDDGSDSGVESLFGVWIHQGFHDGRHYAAHLVQGGLGLEDADDYAGAGADHARRRALYRDHVAKVLRAAGFDQAEARAGRVLALETAIAATHASRADTDDVFKTDNPWSRADFAAKAPGLDWPAYLHAARLDAAPGFVVWQPAAVTGSARLVASQPLEAWKDYLAFHLVEHQAAVLPSAFADERRAFAAALAGAPPPPAPDSRAAALSATEAALGDAVGRLYVERHVPPGTKAAAQAMTADIKAVFRRHILAATWMGPATRERALAKLAALRLNMAYPDRWVDYAPLAVVRGDAYGNLQRAEAFAYARQTAKLAHPADPGEWPDALRPQMAGAILDLSPNTMEFAAGLLQPPYFDPAGDLASNYGSAGAGIAHEVSHSFDEVGEIYDAEGRLGRWRTPADIAAFKAATAPLAAQLDACCPAPDLCAHGRQVLGESAADLIGLDVAHEAYLRALHGRPDAVKDGLTGEQRFFIAFAQRWRRSQSPDALRRQIATDSHAPGPCRAGLVRNLDAWTRAFAVKPGDRLYLAPKDRIHIW